MRNKHHTHTVGLGNKNSILVKGGISFLLVLVFGFALLSNIHPATHSHPILAEGDGPKVGTGG